MHHRHTDPRVLDAPQRVEPIVVVEQLGPNRAQRRRGRKLPTLPAQNVPFTGAVADLVPAVLGAREASRREAAHRLAGILRRDGGDQ
jgi:hypothetical protein